MTVSNTFIRLRPKAKTSVSCTNTSLGSHAGYAGELRVGDHSCANSSEASTPHVIICLVLGRRSSDKRSRSSIREGLMSLDCLLLHHALSGDLRAKES